MKYLVTFILLSMSVSVFAKVALVESIAVDQVDLANNPIVNTIVAGTPCKASNGTMGTWVKGRTWNCKRAAIEAKVQ